MKKPKKNSKLEEFVKKKIKFELKDVLKKIKVKEEEDLVKKVKIKEVKKEESKKIIKVDENNEILYEQSLSQKIDYNSLFSYLGNGEYKKSYETKNSEVIKTNDSDVLSYTRVDEIMVKKMFDDMIGGVKDYLDSNEEARYDLWRKINPAMWRFKFDMNNKFGYKMIVE